MGAGSSARSSALRPPPIHPSSRSRTPGSFDITEPVQARSTAVRPPPAHPSSAYRLPSPDDPIHGGDEGGTKEEPSIEHEPVSSPPPPPARPSLSPHITDTENLVASPPIQPVGSDPSSECPPLDISGTDVKEEEDLSEEQLRQIYLDEEIDRFLHLFSAYVTEVRLPSTRSTENVSKIVSEVSTLAEADPTLISSQDSEDGDWVPIAGSFETSPSAPPLPPRPKSQTEPQYQSLSENIAFRFIVPNLPPPPPPPPPFTLGRLRLATQRLYLAVEPTYLPFLKKLARLATWQDRQESALYCSVFWLLWLYNLLLPSLLLRVLYGLVRHKLNPYPSLQDLRKRRYEAARAQSFAAEVQHRLARTSTIELKEVWRLFKVARASNQKVKQKFSKGKEPMSEQVEETEATTVLDDTGKDSAVENDLKQIGLQAMNGIADIHERVRNIFLWRRPLASWLYGAIIAILFVATLVIPAKYLAKMVYATIGIVFWHLVPILVAVPPADRARLPPPLDDVPTDAEYAMELISQRVAHGLDVMPRRQPRAGTKSSSSDKSAPLLSENSRSGSFDQGSSQDDASGQPDEDNKINWKKWGERAATGKQWIESGKRLATGKDKWARNGSWPPKTPLIPGLALAHGEPAGHIETHTYPAQHTKGPGLITLTPVTFYFTPMLSANAKVTIMMEDICGVKKAGPMRGLHIRWIDTAADNCEREEKFRWVGERDELFARLVGWQRRPWIKV